MSHSGAAGKVSMALLAAMVGLIALQGFVLPSVTWISSLVPLLWLSSMGIAIWAAVEGHGRRFAIATLVIAVALVALWIVLSSVSNGPQPVAR